MFNLSVLVIYLDYTKRNKGRRNSKKTSENNGLVLFALNYGFKKN